MIQYSMPLHRADSTRLYGRRSRVTGSANAHCNMAAFFTNSLRNTLNALCIHVALLALSPQSAMLWGRHRPIAGRVKAQCTAHQQGSVCKQTGYPQKHILDR